MIELKVDGVIYGGWKSARIPFGIEQIANSFELTVTDRWSDQVTPRPIKVGSKCQILIDGRIVITGYVDDVNPDFDDISHTISVSGRDAAGDLVDCSAIHKSGQWVNNTLDKIVRDVCAPFGIKVTVDTEMGAAFETFNIEEGETAFECIDRACRMRAVMPISNGIGGVVLTRAKVTKAIAELVQGKNIRRCSGAFSLRERFSVYYIKGQDRGSDDDDDATLHSQVSATVTDSFITRHRPLIVLAEDKGAHSTFKQRAEWERNVRRGRSARASITVNGWQNVSGDLWRANTMARVKSEFLSVDTDLLIAGGTYILSDSEGELTELSLVGREAFDLTAGVKATKLKSAITGKNGASNGANGEKKKKNGEDFGVEF